MKKQTSHIVEVLYQRGRLQKKEYEQIGNWDEDGPSKEIKMLQLNMVTQEDLDECYAYLYDIPIERELPNLEIVSDHYKKLGFKFLKENGALPLCIVNGKLQVLTYNPKNILAMEEIGFIFEMTTETRFCQRHLFEELLQKLFSNKQEDLYKGFKEKQIAKQAGVDLLEADESTPVVKLLNHILQEAIEKKCSDIHFEPSEKGLKLRFRIDGVLQSRPMPNLEIQDQLLTRLKVMAQLDIAEHRLPQDGRIRLVVGGRDIDLRVSLVPIADGQRIVLRILDKAKTFLNISELNMPQEIERPFKKQIKKAEGIILVTGPTGSGKSTTLYSALSHINHPSINIMTIEDPIEYRLDGISQMAVNPKIELNFAKGLRHLLRQDPDVIMIGEIRDTETAKIAIQSSLTGHLVFSTLHTNDAPSAITRLAEMGIETYLLSSSIIGVLAQRLVRTICPHCKIEYEPTAEELEEMQLEKRGPLFKGEGCDRCFNSGYYGRVALFEWLEMSASIKKQIHASLDADALKTVALLEGMHTLKTHGAQLALQGITTIYEVARVAG